MSGQQLGPCIVCGDTNYNMSCGGPMICPKCDCGNFDAATVQRQAKIIAELREELERSRALLTLALHTESSAPAQRTQDSRLEKAVEILRRRAAGYEGRATAIFSGRIMADELRGNAREIEALADSQAVTSTDGIKP